MDSNDIIRLVSDGFDKAKGGEAAEVYAAVSEIHDRGALPLKSHYPFGWIIYYALHQSPPQAIRQRKLMLARYLKLNVAKPHKLHSMILTEAIRLYKDASTLMDMPGRTCANGQESVTGFSIVRFVDLWNLANLRPGDHRRKEHEGKTLPSTVEKLITHYVDELYSAKTPASEDFMALVTQALADNPASENLHAQASRLYELAGDKTKAVDMLRNAILASSSKFYLWGRLAELVADEGNTRLTVSLLYKALKAPGQDSFKGRIRLRLAKTMADAGSLPHAKWELDIVRRLYEANGWNLPRLHKETDRMIPADTVASDPTPVYRKLESLADAYIFESLPVIAVRKTYHKEASASGYSPRGGRTAWRVTTDNGENYWLQPSRFGIPDTLPHDTRLLIKVFNGKVVKAALSR